MNCYNSKDILQFLDRKLSSSKEKEFVQHLSNCQKCKNNVLPALRTDIFLLKASLAKTTQEQKNYEIMTNAHSFKKASLEALQEYVSQNKGDIMNCEYIAFKLKDGKTICAAFDKLTDCNRKLEDFGNVDVHEKDERSQNYSVERCSHIDELIVQKAFPILSLFKRCSFSPPYLGPHCYPEGEYKQGQISKAELITRSILPSSLCYNEYPEEFFKLAYDLISKDKLVLSKEQKKSIIKYTKFCEEWHKNLSDADIDAILKRDGELYRRAIAAKFPPLSNQKSKEIKLKVFQKALGFLPKGEYKSRMKKIFPDIKDF